MNVGDLPPSDVPARTGIVGASPPRNAPANPAAAECIDGLHAEQWSICVRAAAPRATLDVMADAPSLDDDLALAHRLADLAGEVSLGFYHRGVETITKPDGSPVSEGDLETDRQLVAMLALERPDDAVLSEESGVHGASNRRWILDPVDGTFNFVSQQPAWGNHIALEVDGELVLGVVTRPVYEQRWWSTLGGGAWRADVSALDAPTRLRVSTNADLATARIGVWSHPPEERLAELGAAFVIVNPPGMDNILEVAAGELDAVIESRGEIWDHAPMVLLVTEAGGKFRDPQGGVSPGLGKSRYTNGLIDDALHAFLDR
jgi:histidinol-phosphatase